MIRTIFNTIGLTRGTFSSGFIPIFAILVISILTITPKFNNIFFLMVFWGGFFLLDLFNLNRFNKKLIRLLFLGISFVIICLSYTIFGLSSAKMGYSVLVPLMYFAPVLALLIIDKCHNEQQIRFLFHFIALAVEINIADNVRISYDFGMDNVVFQRLGGMVEEAGSTVVKTSEKNRGRFKDDPSHEVGYFAYYNNGLFDNGPVPLVFGCHGGGDSSMYLTFVAGWWEIAKKYNFLFVSVENHQFVTATEVVEVIEGLKKRYNIDERRIYATGFSMGSGKTWDLYQEYPEVFAGIMPASALFPVYTTFFGKPVDKEKLNMTVPVPVFYSGGEKSHLPELPFQADSSLERVKYVAQVQKLKKKFDDVSFEEKENWEDPIWAIPGDRIEKVRDESRDAVLTIHYYDSEDGVCRTAFASVDNQIHECRQHSVETAWKFISKFKKVIT